MASIPIDTCVGLILEGINRIYGLWVDCRDATNAVNEAVDNLGEMTDEYFLQDKVRDEQSVVCKNDHM